MAKELVKKWKNEVGGAKGGGSSTAHAHAVNAAKPPRASSNSSHSLWYLLRGDVFRFAYLPNGLIHVALRKVSVAADSAGSPTTPTVSSFSRSAKTDGIVINATNDKTRDKCIELIYDALVLDSAAREFRGYLYSYSG